LIILLLGTKHPRVVDEAESLPLSRKIIAFAALIIFILSFSPAPIKGYGLLELAKHWGL